jgi:hypothetical protein
LGGLVSAWRGDDIRGRFIGGRLTERRRAGIHGHLRTEDCGVAEGFQLEGAGRVNDRGSDHRACDQAEVGGHGLPGQDIVCAGNNPGPLTDTALVMTGVSDEGLIVTVTQPHVSGADSVIDGSLATVN